jgi:hypothetical protein
MTTTQKVMLGTLVILAAVYMYNNYYKPVNERKKCIADGGTWQNGICYKINSVSIGLPLPGQGMVPPTGSTLG